MSQDEEINLLRRDLADLRDRVARLEEAGRFQGAIGTPPPMPVALPLNPTSAPAYPAALPYNPNIWIAPQPSNDCGCAAGTMCLNVACPRRAGVTYTGVVSNAAPNT